MLRPLKTVQAAGVLLKEHGGRMSRLRLLKMLYMADRKSMKTLGRTVTGDRPFAMENGPVLTRVYDLVKGTDAETGLWVQFIHRQGYQDLCLVADTGVDELSQFEVESLVEIASVRRDKDDYDVVEETHQFQEWIKNKPAPGSSNLIPWDDVLSALELSGMKEILAKEAYARQKASQLLR